MLAIGSGHVEGTQKQAIILETTWSATRLVGMRELSPVRICGIPHTAIAVPPRATKMAHIERTAKDDIRPSNTEAVIRPNKECRESPVFPFCYSALAI